MGADINVTLSQQHMGRWRKGEDAPCNLGAEHGAKFNYWLLKVAHLSFLRCAPEATQDSLYGLIHLAVRDLSPQNFALLQLCLRSGSKCAVM